MAGQTPIWKKEIRLRHRAASAAPKTAVDGPEQQPQSIWKKEIKLSKSQKKAKQAAAISVAEAEPQAGSIWKKEIRIRRSVPKTPALEISGMELIVHESAQAPEPVEVSNSELATTTVDLEPLVLDDPPDPPTFEYRTDMPSPLAPMVSFDLGPTEPRAPVPARLYRQSDPDQWPGVGDDVAEDPPAAEAEVMEQRLFQPDEPAIGNEPAQDAPVNEPIVSGEPAWSRNSWLSPTETSFPREADGAPAPFDPDVATGETPVDRDGLESSWSTSVDAPGFYGTGTIEDDFDLPGPEAPSGGFPEVSSSTPGDDGGSYRAENREAGPSEASEATGEAFATFGATEAERTTEPTPAAAPQSWYDEQAATAEPEDPFGTDSFPGPFELGSFSGVTAEDESFDQSGFEEALAPEAAAEPRYTFEPEQPETGQEGLDGGIAAATAAAAAASFATEEDRSDTPIEQQSGEILATRHGDFAAAPMAAAPVAGSALGAEVDRDPDDSTAGTIEPDVPSEVDPKPGLVSAAAAADADADADTDTDTDKDVSEAKNRRSKSSSSQVVGVRIGSSQIVVSVVRNTPGAAELLQLASAPIDRGVVIAGEVREPDALAIQLKSIFAKHKLPKKGIRLGIASTRVGVKTIEVPAIEDRKALENAIRFRAQEVLSIPLSDAILDHVVLGETETDNGPALRVLLVFAHRDLVDRYLEAFKRARLKVSSVDFEAFALLRAVTGPGNDVSADRATVALSVGQERTIFAVAEGGVCDFTRVLEWGGGSLTVALARALDMTPSQAEPVKRTLSLSSEVESSDLSAAQIESARSALQNELQVLARELLASLHFYQSRPGSLALGEIQITGGGLELEGAAEELRERLGVPVKVVDPFEHVRAGKKARVLVDPGAAAIAIGLGMEV